MSHDPEYLAHLAEHGIPPDWKEQGERLRARNLSARMDFHDFMSRGGQTSDLQEKLDSMTEERNRLAEVAASQAASLQSIQDALKNGAQDNGGPGEMEYGAPDEIITEVEPEPASDHRQRLIASDWMRSQMKPGESLAQARNRLLQEYNDLLNRNVTASFANDAERIRFRDLTANMTDFSKG